MNNSEIEGIAQIRSGDRSALHAIYLQHRKAFLDWAIARFRCRKEEAEDVWQDVILIFYENILADKLTDLSSKLRTYLFGIGRNLLLRRLDKATRHMAIEPEIEAAAAWLEEGVMRVEEIPLEEEDRQNQLLQQLKQLGEPCYELLQLYYYHRFSMEAITEKMNYKSADVVKSQKARCMRTLRNQLQHYTRDDF